MNLILGNIALALPEFAITVDQKITAPVTGLYGPSGSGKTTLLEIIAGLRKLDAGCIELDGKILTNIRDRIHVPPGMRRIGYVPQDLALFPHLNTEANLRFGYQPGESVYATPERVIEVLELAPLLRRSVDRLSGGEKQRVAIGRALLANPGLLLLDEPLSNLDDRLRERILDCLKTIHETFHVPMLYVSHSQKELEYLCQQILCISMGRIVPTVDENRKLESGARK